MRRSNPLILLVEDRIEDETLVVSALKKGCGPAAVHIARDGKEAHDFLFGEGRLPQPPDLILLDIRLPKIGGLELLKRIRQDRELSDVPVVMLTSSDDWNDIDQSYKLGANSFIRKDEDPKQFMEDVKMAGAYWITVNLPQTGVVSNMHNNRESFIDVQRQHTTGRR